MLLMWISQNHPERRPCRRKTHHPRPTGSAGTSGDGGDRLDGGIDIQSSPLGDAAATVTQSAIVVFFSVAIGTP
jgi:hypothetical protein